jgi:hypothetical protein
MVPSVLAVRFLIFEVLMKKAISLAFILGLVASSAVAGGYSSPLVAAEPVVVAATPKSGMGLLPLLLLIGVGVAVSSGTNGSRAR